MRLPFLLCGLLISASVAAQAEPAPTLQLPDEVPAQSARLVLSRSPDAPTACDVELQLGERQVVTLAAGKQTELELPPGEHVARLRLSRAGYCGTLTLGSDQSIVINPGERRHLQVVYDNEALFLAPVDDESGSNARP